MSYGKYPPMPLDRQQFEELEEILQVLSAERASLNAASQNFVEDQVERVAKYGVEIRLSPKQWNWLRDLYEKHAVTKPVAPEPRDPRDDDDNDEISF
jgi:hypothetical protein